MQLGRSAWATSWRAAWSARWWSSFGGAPAVHVLARLDSQQQGGVGAGPGAQVAAAPGSAQPQGEGGLADVSADADCQAGEAELRAVEMLPVPAIVLARTLGNWYVPPPDLSIDGFWQRSQVELVQQLNAPLVVAADAGHALAREASELVAWGGRRGRYCR